MEQQLGHQSCPSCPSSDAFYRWPDGGGYCFSCRYRQQGDKVERFLSNLKSRTMGDIALLPDDFEYYIPEEPQEWLSQFGLTVAEMAIHRIGWSDTKSSLIFPVFGEKDELLFYQSRYFGTDEKFPKWLTRPKGTTRDTPLTSAYKDGRIVLVEDLISKIKVSRITNAVAMFGSDVPMGLFLSLKAKFKSAVVWMDPDAKKKATEIALMIGGVMPCKLIFSGKDPKWYTTKEIKEYIDA